MRSKSYLFIGGALLALAGLGSCGYKHAKYVNPITSDSDQPDKKLFDSSVRALEKGQYEIARINLNVLLNTYESSEYTAKAKLAIGDSWLAEGGTRGYAQAEAEYKDFILFYRNLEEAPEAQKKICEIHYRQMEKADRDPAQALNAEDACRQLLVQFPNSKFVPEVEQKLRDIQEVLAESDFVVASFYRQRGDPNASTGRFGEVADQYPLYSKADSALWYEGEGYRRMGASFRRQEVDALTRIVRDYPLSQWADDAKKRLGELEVPIPAPDPAALALMQANKDGQDSPGMFSRTFGFMRRGPDTWTAAKNGAPQLKAAKRNFPPLIPAAGPNAGFQGDVTVSVPTNPASAAPAAPATAPRP